MPTLEELGFTNIDGFAFALSAGAGTPREVTDKLFDVCARVLQSPDVKARFAKLQITAVGERPQVTLQNYERERLLFRCSQSRSVSCPSRCRWAKRAAGGEQHRAWRLRAELRPPVGQTRPGPSRPCALHHRQLHCAMAITRLFAITAGFSCPSISTVVSVVIRTRPFPFASTETIFTRHRTHAPDITGARKRTRSSP